MADKEYPEFETDWFCRVEDDVYSEAPPTCMGDEHRDCGWDIHRVFYLD